MEYITSGTLFEYTIVLISVISLCVAIFRNK